MSRTFLRSGGGPGSILGSLKGQEREADVAAARPPPYLYFMPVPRPVLLSRAPAGPGGRGEHGGPGLGARTLLPWRVPMPHADQPAVTAPGPGRGPHRRSSLLRLRRFCSVHAIDTCMWPAKAGEGAPRGGGRGTGKPRETPGGCSGASPGRAGRLEEVAAGAAR